MGQWFSDRGGVTPYYIISFTSVVGQRLSDRRSVTPYYIVGLTAVVGHGLSGRRGVTPYYIISFTFVVVRGLSGRRGRYTLLYSKSFLCGSVTLDCSHNFVVIEGVMCLE